jgi:hypothetical protein
MAEKANYGLSNKIKISDLEIKGKAAKIIIDE